MGGKGARSGGVVRLVHRLVPEPLFACPHCRGRLPRRQRREIWVETPVERGWVAAYRIVLRERQPLVAEVRVFPDEPGHDAGRWSEEADTVSPGGVPGRALPKLRLRDAMILFPQVIERWNRASGGRLGTQVLGRFATSGSPEAVPRRPGRAGRPDRYYAIWANAYVDRLREGSATPVKDLTTAPPVVLGVGAGEASEATIRDTLTEARERGLLTSSPRGKAGGELTPKALRLLRRS